MGNVNAIYKGKWIIQYDKNEFQYPQVLELLPEIVQNREKNEQEAEYKQVTISKKSTGGGILFQSADSVKTFQFYSDGLAKMGKIQTVHLFSPVRMNDRRWDTIHFTTASMFLGSALTEAGFHVSTDKLIMPVVTVEKTMVNADLLGFTLFEDLFTETRAFFDILSQERFHGLLAGGGPMVTLNPIQTARHLPELNLLVRGEAEFVLPCLLKALNTRNLSTLLKLKGFLFQLPGTIIICDLNYINKPEEFTGFRFNLDFLEPKHLEKGLEINLSRGCSRGCIFCSHVQGRKLRKLPPKIFDQLLIDVSNAVEFKKSEKQISRFETNSNDQNLKHKTMSLRYRIGANLVFARDSRTININDDDVLQDMDYAKSVFGVIKKHGFKLWGIQTSVDSFFKRDHTIDFEVLDAVADQDLFVDADPLVWVGTDAFLKERGKRLGKWIPTEPGLYALIEALEERGIRNYHYWISSDQDTQWEDFAREFLLLYRLHETFKHFGLLAHSPFLVPYSTTPLYRMLNANPDSAGLIKYKQVLSPGKDLFRFPLVDRVETRYPHLNRLLNNERLNNRLGFFEYLKQKDYLNAIITLYDFLKMERLSFEAFNDVGAKRLLKSENEVENFISAKLRAT